eukprot:403360032
MDLVANKIEKWNFTDQIQMRVITTIEEVDIACRLVSKLICEHNPMFSNGKLGIDAETLYRGYFSFADLIIKDNISIIVQDVVTKQYVGAVLNIDFIHSVNKIQSFEDTDGKYRMEDFYLSNLNPDDNLRRRGLKFIKSQFYLFVYNQMQMFNQNALQKHSTVELIGGGVIKEYHIQGFQKQMLDLSSQYQHEKYGYQYCVSVQINHISQHFTDKYWRSLLKIEFDCTNFMIDNEIIFEGVPFYNDRILYQASLFSMPLYNYPKL